MLDWNAKKVQNLTSTEIWLFILGRVLVAFAVGVYVNRYYPLLSKTIAFPAFVIGMVLFAIASKGMWRKTSN
jgi:hypothetical protein